MNSRLIFAIVSAVVLVNAVESSRILERFNFNVVGTRCTGDDIFKLSTNCMIPFASSDFNGFITLMSSGGVCNTTNINCRLITDTQLCMGRQSITVRCRANLRQMSDIQFSMLGSACRVADFEAACTTEFRDAQLLA